MPPKPRWRGTRFVIGGAGFECRRWLQKVFMAGRPPWWGRGYHKPDAVGSIPTPATKYGEVAERPKAPVLKTGAPQGAVGSIPTLSSSMEAWLSGYGTGFENRHSLRGSQVRVLPLPPVRKMGEHGRSRAFAKRLSPQRAMRVRIPCLPPARRTGRTVRHSLGKRERPLKGV